MHQAPSVTIGGAFGSPYSLKMRAVLRYRRIPFRWILRGSRWDDLPDVPVKVIPVLSFDDAEGNHGETMVDSSPQISRLEAVYSGRSLVPADPALAFLDLLIEDYADEWVTKMMYHYRWTYAPDIEKAGRLLPLDQDLQGSDEHLARAHDHIIERQVGRRAFVGSTDANLPIIEGSYQRLLELLQTHLGAHDFLLGERPGRGDFAVFGQLKPLLCWDPTPMAVAVARAPRAINWMERVDDLSWWHVDGDEGWFDVASSPHTVHSIVHEIGTTYAPFMLANAAAIDDGDDEVVCEIRDEQYRQSPFKYQAKCLTWLREAYSGLDDAARTTVRGLLDGTGCEGLLT